MFQEVCQKQETRSIETVFMCEKCMVVSHGLGIAFGTLFWKNENFWYLTFL